MLRWGYMWTEGAMKYKRGQRVAGLGGVSGAPKEKGMSKTKEDEGKRTGTNGPRPHREVLRTRKTGDSQVRRHQTCERGGWGT